MTSLGSLSQSADTTTMKLFFSSTSYPTDTTDWKGLFILRMLEGLAKHPALDIEAWCPPGPYPKGVTNALYKDDSEWLQGLSARGGIAQQLRTHPLQGITSGAALVSRLRRALARSQADIFHINWLQNALALPRDGRPALVTALGTDIQLLRLPLLSEWLRSRLKGRNVALCPNAEWMVPILERKFGDIARVECVPFGIDKAWYDTKRAPQADAPLRWTCVTRLTKGKLGPLFEWSEPFFSNGNRELHLFGPRQDAGISVPGWVKFHGPATPTQLREEVFPRSSGLVSLSTHPEGRPQVMLEAMAAGLPILASRLPAHLDVVEHQVNGWICEDEASFAEGLAFVESAAHNQAMGQRAREMATSRYGNWDDCANRYANLYQSLLQRRQ